MVSEPYSEGSERLREPIHIQNTNTHNLVRMNPEGSSIPLTLPLFDGKSYHLWAFRMEAYLEAGDLWEAVEDVYEVEPLSDNPTVAQIKNH